MSLGEISEQSWFTFSPIVSAMNNGQVINYNDFFYIGAIKSSTPFYLHVFNKPGDEYTNQISFNINAS
jgi:hypothetical protein